MKVDFRFMARNALKKAKKALSENKEQRTQEAALYLRMAIEALTYERSQSYQEELGPDKMKTWQPKRLMERMLEVDPHADKTATLAFGIEPSYGVAPDKMTLLGSDNVFDLKTIKKHYDALGSYLHTPTLLQLEKGKSHDFVKLRKRCETIIEEIETVLGSKVWGSTLAIRGEIECQGCNNTILRRLESGQTRKVECWECQATYNLSETDDNKAFFEPRQHKITCPSDGCGVPSYIWENDFKIGSSWACDECGSKLTIAYGVTIDVAS